MADTAIDICSRALVLIGEKPITSFSAGDTPSIVANQLYEPCVKAMLGSRRWGFANTTQQLSRKTGTPVAAWDAEYELPSDLLLIRRITVDDAPIRYERFASTIRCNAGVDDVVVMTYVRRVAEAEFPSFFTGALEIELAARFVLPISGSETLMAFWMREARKAWAEARSAGSQEQTAQRLPISRFKAVRLGRG